MRKNHTSEITQLFHRITELFHQITQLFHLYDFPPANHSGELNPKHRKFQLNYYNGYFYQTANEPLHVLEP